MIFAGSIFPKEEYMTDQELARIMAVYCAEPNPDMLGKLVNQVAEFLYFNIGQYRLRMMDEDFRGDFIVWIYPRLSVIINRYSAERALFKTYLRGIISTSWYNFLRQRIKTTAKERVVEQEEETRLLSIEAEGYTRSEQLGIMTAFEQPGTPKMKAIKRRSLLLLACKAGRQIGDEDIEKVARTCNISVPYLQNKIEVLRKECSKIEDKFFKKQENRYYYYLRARRCLVEMSYHDPVSATYARLKEEYAWCRKRIQVLDIERRRLSRGPSNRLIARCLEIPRGTVDASLAHAQQRWYP